MHLTAAEIEALPETTDPVAESSGAIRDATYKAASAKIKADLEALGLTVEEDEPTPEDIEDEPEDTEVAPQGLASVRTLQGALNLPVSGTWDVETQRAWEAIVEDARLPGKHAEGIRSDWMAHAVDVGFEPTVEGMVAFIEATREAAANRPAPVRAAPPSLWPMPKTAPKVVEAPAPKPKRSRKKD